MDPGLAQEVLSSLILSHWPVSCSAGLTSCSPQRRGSGTTCLLWMSKLRIREVKAFVQDCTAGEEQRRELNPGLLCASLSDIPYLPPDWD